GREVLADWAGPAPGLPGLTQVNVTIPASTPAGSVPVVFRLNTAYSNAATLAVQ
ncbi:MAG: hypothetical protein LAQ30_32880, partial [Acidobacteriia bacterium]|nr:hypothetical protein [Terriglobia bacterium]